MSIGAQESSIKVIELSYILRQQQRAAILFEEYPDIKTAYGLCHSLRMIFSKNTIKDAARLSMARWYNKIEEAGLHSFNVIAATFYVFPNYMPIPTKFLLTLYASVFLYVKFFVLVCQHGVFKDGLRFFQ